MTRFGKAITALTSILIFVAGAVAWRSFSHATATTRVLPVRKQIAAVKLDPNAEFKRFITEKLIADQQAAGGDDANPQYQLLYSGDLNGDNKTDYVIRSEYDCGNSVCAPTVYIADDARGYRMIATNFGMKAKTVYAEPSDNVWKHLVAKPYEYPNGPPIFIEAYYDRNQSAFTAYSAFVCRTGDSPGCSDAMHFCLVSGSSWDLKEDAHFYSLPSQTSHSEQHPGGRHWIVGATIDGQWFLVDASLDSPSFVLADDVTGFVGSADYVPAFSKIGCETRYR